MGLTEGHWFEDEEPELTERQLEEAVYIQDNIYKRGYHKGYSDGAKEQKEKYEKEVFRLRARLKEQEPKEPPLIIRSLYRDKLYGYVAECPECDTTWIMYFDSEIRYCPGCGKEVEWEE